MESKTTNELEQILKKTHPDQIDQFLHDHGDKLVSEDKSFSNYMHDLIREKGLTQQKIFLLADFPERYGYKLLSEEKKTRQRDYLLRIFYAAGMGLEETQKALTLYGMAPLYAKFERDAILMIAFNRHIGDIGSINALLVSHGLEPLRTCGSLD